MLKVAFLSHAPRRQPHPLPGPLPNGRGNVGINARGNLYFSLARFTGEGARQGSPKRPIQWTLWASRTPTPTHSHGGGGTLCFLRASKQIPTLRNCSSGVGSSPREKSHRGHRYAPRVKTIHPWFCQSAQKLPAAQENPQPGAEAWQSRTATSRKNHSDSPQLSAYSAPREPYSLSSDNP